jgi:chromate transporter
LKAKRQMMDVLETQAPRPGYAELGATFLRIGATTFGGMWAATQQLEDRLVRDKRWLTLAHQQTLMVAGTLIPAPKFLAFGGLVGYHLRGWRGGLVAILALIAPGALFVLLGAMLLDPAVMGAPLVTIQRAVSIAVVGLLLGNAYHQVKAAKVSGRKYAIGIALTLSVVGASLAGVPLLLAALAGFVIGALVLRESAGEPQ